MLDRPGVNGSDCSTAFRAAYVPSGAALAVHIQRMSEEACRRGVVNARPSVQGRVHADATCALPGADVAAVESHPRIDACNNATVSDGYAPATNPHRHTNHPRASATDPDAHHIEAVCHRAEATS